MNFTKFFYVILHRIVSYLCVQLKDSFAVISIVDKKFSGNKRVEEVPKNNKKPLPRDYKAWDKYDVDDELDKLDKEEKKDTPAPAVHNEKVSFV